MSNEAPKHKLSIVNRIMILLNVGEIGKIGHFFEKQVKTLQRMIEANKRNIDNIKFNSEVTINQYNEELEDAKTEVENCYVNVALADVENNAKADNFANTYWDRIESAEAKVKRIKDRIKNHNEEVEKQIKDTNIQITELQRRIENISSDKK